MTIFKHQQCNMNSPGQIQLTQPSHLSPPLFIPVLGGIHIEFEGRIIQVEAQSLEFVAIHMHEGLQVGGHRGPYQTEWGMKNKKKHCFSWNCPRFWGCAADDVESLLCLQIMFRFSHARQTHQKNMATSWQGKCLLTVQQHIDALVVTTRRSLKQSWPSSRWAQRRFCPSPSSVSTQWPLLFPHGRETSPRDQTYRMDKLRITKWKTYLS